MAYRRRQQTSTSNPTSFDDDEEEQHESPRTNSYSSSTSIAAKAIRASSAARRDSSLYSAYGFDHRSPSSPTANAASTSTAASTTSASSFSSKDQRLYEYTSMKPLNEPKQGFWGSLARKAKSVLDDDSSAQQFVSPGRTGDRMPQTSTEPKYQNPEPSQDNHQRTENRTIHKGLHAISSSLNYIGNAVEEGLSKVENRTADIIQGTRKHIRKKPNAADVQNQVNGRGNTWQQPHVQAHMQPQMQTDQELQLKASRDVAMAMAAKAKLLLRELKTVKADLAFAKERCAQLEEENKMLREHNERGDNPEDDDLIRLQLETLLSEKARLAHENSIYARENRFLREVVEYHQLTMQDVVYLDEGTEEVTEVYPIKVVSNTPPVVAPEASLGSNLRSPRDISLYPVPPPGILEHPQSSLSPTNTGTDTEKHSNPWG
ncbi:uncharacterized protein [Euphorbia lathyris]|uniref:uncharacterized protein n=1 Tax=Euphorbia lathyris TaxID=212925 RepID=UPI0033133D4D